MRLRVPPALPVTFLVVWVLACVFAFYFASSTAVFVFSYFVLPFSAFIVPLCIAHASCRLVGFGETSTKVHPHSIGLSLTAAIVGVAAYGLSATVVGRFLELPWRVGKFGDTSLTLGKSAAEFFSFAAVLVALSAFALLRVAPPKSQ